MLVCILLSSYCLYVCVFVCARLCQVSSLRQDLQVKEKQYEVRLQAVEDTHRQSALELREMLTAQQQMSAKYVQCWQVSASTGLNLPGRNMFLSGFLPLWQKQVSVGVFEPVFIQNCWYTYSLTDFGMVQLEFCYPV